MEGKRRNSLEKLVSNLDIGSGRIQKNIVLVGDAECGKTNLFNIYADKGIYFHNKSLFL